MEMFEKSPVAPEILPKSLLQLFVDVEFAACEMEIYERFGTHNLKHFEVYFFLQPFQHYVIPNVSRKSHYSDHRSVAALSRRVCIFSY